MTASPAGLCFQINPANGQVALAPTLSNGPPFNDVAQGGDWSVVVTGTGMTAQQTVLALLQANGVIPMPFGVSGFGPPIRWQVAYSAILAGTARLVAY